MSIPPQAQPADPTPGDVLSVVDPGVLAQLTPSDAQNLLMLVRGELPPAQGDDAALSLGVRNLSGFGNNQIDPSRASLDEPFVRLTPARFGELNQETNSAKINPIFKDLDPRSISNLIGAQSADTPPSEQASNLFMAFSQYLDHGLDFLPKGGNGTIAIGNQIPGDANNPADLTRGTILGWSDGVPLYRNQDTPYVDQNQAYGPIEVVGQLLRCSDGHGGFGAKLFTSDKPDPSALGHFLLPNLRELLDHHLQAGSRFSTDQGEKTLIEYYPALLLAGGYYNAAVVQQLASNAFGSGYNLLIDANPAINLLDHVISGDGRANENVGLTGLHTIFARNHNYHAEQLEALYADQAISVSPEELFQAAKIVNEAEYQRIVFTEFAQKVLGGPGLLGEGNHGFKDYSPAADAQISLEFQAIAYRLGHTMIPEDYWVLDANGNPQPRPLIGLFLNPTSDPSAFSVDHDRNPNTAPLTGQPALDVLARMGYVPAPGYAELGTASVLGGIARQPAEEVDGKMVDAVRNDLVRVRADLFSANVARGWDLGMGTLNQIKQGLLASTSPYVTEAVGYVGGASLEPYASWQEFQTRNGLSDDVLGQFQQAYPDLVLSGEAWVDFQRFNPEINALQDGDQFIVPGIDRVDAWVGGLVERKVGDALVGPTFWVILHEQLDRLQEADRFYYIPRLENLDLYANFVEDSTFAKILARNTGLTDLPERVFDVVAAAPPADQQAGDQPAGDQPADDELAGGADPDAEQDHPANTNEDAEDGDTNEDAEDGDTNEDEAPEPTGPALQLGLSIVKNPVFAGDSETDMVLRRFGTEFEQGSKFYLALTAASLRNASINTLDLSVNLGETFGEVFELLPADSSGAGPAIHFNDAMAVQRRVQVLNGENGPTIRFEGAGLDALASSGAAIADTTVLAYIELVARGDIDDLIEAARVEDQYGFMNAETFSVPMLFTVDANVDHVVFSDLESLRDLGGADVLLNPELEVTARAAEAVLTTSSIFDLGTYREVVQVGEGSYTNLVRSGDTILQASSWRNDGEFSFTDLRIESISDAVAEVSASFKSTGTSVPPSLGWSDQTGQGEMMEVSTSLHIIGKAGSVVDTSAVGYALSAYGNYGWNTTQMEQFQVKHLVTYQADLNYDGAVTMKDLAFLNAGAAMGNKPHDVDADFDGSIDMRDLAVIDEDWGKSLHSGDDKFLGSDSITMDELFRQNGRRWDSSAFEEQNAIEADEAGSAYVNVLTDESSGLISAAGLASSVVTQWEEQHSQQYALTNV
ncbi:hypothetical protein KBY72_10615 [Cyanobium sp. BA5m-21]|uniref:peroxidase family protein n=1 Tax=Cyanobium sp. BA5m-21 TaxID=2823706 RepID=UPI0020CBEF91|nr:peroxidase family protein [Cyanobium sp. BA5m-21]MCP9907620.1 hypothetical protein [Cyanobium sp. BA5m-21]